MSALNEKPNAERIPAAGATGMITLSIPGVYGGLPDKVPFGAAFVKASP
jgi:hypothetical protein